MMPGTRIRDLWLIACLAWAGLAVLASGHETLQIVLWLILGLACTAVVVSAIFWNQVWARRGWAMVAASTALGVIGYLFWIDDVDHPGLPASELLWDWALLAIAVVAMVAAVLTFARKQHASVEEGGWLDAALVFLLLLMPVSELAVFPIWFNPVIDRSIAVALMAIASLALLLVACAARLWFVSDARINRAFRFLCLGISVCVLLVGVVLVVAIGEEPAPPEWVVRPLDSIGAWVFLTAVGVAASDPTARRPPVGDVSRGLVQRGRAMLLLTLCILMPPTLLVVHAPESKFPGSVTFAVETAALAVVLGIRINVLVLRYRAAIRREQALREVNAALMRITQLDEISHGISEWSARLVEQTKVTGAIGTDAELKAMGVGELASRVRDGRASFYRTVVGVPGTRPARRLVVDTPEPVKPEALASLAVLGQSIGMALERLSLARRIVERATAQRLELLLHNASDVIALVDEAGTIRYLTEAIRDITRSSPRTYSGREWASIFDDPAMARAILARARAQEGGGDSAGELAITPHVGEARRLAVNAAWLPDEREFVVTHNDVTERHELQEELAYQAFHDDLTGLKNRAVFREQLDQSSARSRRSTRNFAVLMVDLDDFKQINDTLGHPFGDEVLRVMAGRLVACMRSGDTAVRLGGDEFAAILESTPSVEAATAVADRVLDRIAEPAEINGIEVTIRGSAGIILSDGHLSPAELERDVDIALYEAKYSGKGRVCVFTPALQAIAQDRIAVTSDLRGAVKRGEIGLRYQPIVDLVGKGIAGVEALARWNHPVRGETLPNAFITYAEESGEIDPLGVFVIQTALGELAGWRERMPEHAGLRLTVNLSAYQLRSPEIVEAVLDALATADLDPGVLIVEVTEGTLLPGDGLPATQLRAMHDAGVSIYIDDFGTGWSSLQYLRRLPVDGLKVAAEFTANLPEPLDLSLVRSIQDMSAALGLDEAIAEGIETEEQREALIAAGFTLGQGFLLGVPHTADELAVVLARTPSAPWATKYDRSFPVPRVKPPTGGR